MGQFGQRVGGAGRDHQQVGGLGQPHVQHVRLSAPQIGIGEGLAAGDRLEGERRDEFFGGGGQYDIHQRPGLGQFRGQFDGLIGCDGAGDAEQDVLVVENGHIG